MRKSLAGGIVTLCMICTTMASCLSSNNENTITLEEAAARLAQAARQTVGSYSGQLYFAQSMNDTRVDSVAVAWDVVTDTTMTVRQVPARVLAVGLTDSIVRKAVEQAEAQTIEARLAFVNYDPISFYVMPKPLSMQVDYGGARHTLTYDFYSYATYGGQGLSGYTYGVYYPAIQAMQVTMIVRSVAVDGVASMSYSGNTVLQLLQR